MAHRLMKYYQYTFEQSGLAGKIKLILMTRLPPNLAAIEKDTPEAVKKFKQFVTEITGKPAPDY
ncbi:MAG TPA: hypothetical protein VLW84_08330 [Terriglobales bacterium]|nr:hypothetical protein [Terriglobales bacterium]